MPIWKLQVAIAADSVFPRDKMVMTPHFNDQGATTDPQSLCTDLAAALKPWITNSQGHQIEVTAYDAQGAVPVVPQGYAVVSAGLAAAMPCPREIAVCLSFYSGFNRARQRGRLYVPYGLIGTAAGLDVRPSATVRTKIGTLAPILQDLGGVDVDWCIFSKVGNVARPVTNWWVDDEWDTVRSRGLRATTRTQGTTSEA